MEKTKKKKKWPKIVLLVFVLLLVGGGAYAYSVYHSLTKNIKEMHEPITRSVSDKRSNKLDVEKQHPFSVLMLGVDQRKNDSGRSDTMIVATINPKKQSVEMVSIPRDTRVEIVGKNKEDKINHAFAFGGTETAIKTVEEFLEIPIDYVVNINMEGFRDIVDAVGGITVNNDLDFSYGGHHYKKGEISLNGEEALSYVRMRKEDPRGDFGRQIRQRQAIESIVKKAISFSSITRYQDIFDAVGNNVKTNMTLSDIMNIQKNYRAASQKIIQHEIEGEGTRIDNIYYFIPNEEDVQELRDMLKKHLDLKSSDKINTIDKPNSNDKTETNSKDSNQ
ncbi:polyisoprenyl-teichoic acid--peptidoglycan teichoic acid transferase TagU [Bacillus massiliigorillae]|uniref:polyisoprenyl-teichoic acid--peptidoglycan teichoic acid transferase TagU n=1 Tax=Bacillus massiliigorillae TaxID=1243664 RepID=UPI0003AB3070|nr:LytR family transcriptional regulator [Bacillus massiliigorillae]